jgi:aryl-alcohol dehydrogenase-like predicted oxidoreductase
MKKLPLQPNWLNRNWLIGAKVQRKTGLPAMASPLANGLLTWKYFPMMVTDGWRLKERPNPAGKQERRAVTFTSSIFRG